jgi:hypothetical protein
LRAKAAEDGTQLEIGPTPLSNVFQSPEINAQFPEASGAEIPSKSSLICEKLDKEINKNKSE